MPYPDECPYACGSPKTGYYLLHVLPFLAQVIIFEDRCNQSLYMVQTLLFIIPYSFARFDRADDATWVGKGHHKGWEGRTFLHFGWWGVAVKYQKGNMPNETLCDGHTDPYFRTENFINVAKVILMISIIFIR